MPLKSTISDKKRQTGAVCPAKASKRKWQQWMLIWGKIGRFHRSTLQGAPGNEADLLFSHVLKKNVIQSECVHLPDYSSKLLSRVSDCFVHLIRFHLFVFEICRHFTLWLLLQYHAFAKTQNNCIIIVSLEYVALFLLLFKNMWLGFKKIN